MARAKAASQPQAREHLHDAHLVAQSFGERRSSRHLDELGSGARSRAAAPSAPRGHPGVFGCFAEARSAYQPPDGHADSPQRETRLYRESESPPEAADPTPDESPKTSRDLVENRVAHARPGLASSTRARSRAPSHADGSSVLRRSAAGSPARSRRRHALLPHARRPRGPRLHAWLQLHAHAQPDEDEWTGAESRSLASGVLGPNQCCHCGRLRLRLRRLRLRSPRCGLRRHAPSDGPDPLLPRSACSCSS